MDSASPRERLRRRLGFAAVIGIGLVLMALMSALSISFGAADMSVRTAWEALFAYDPAITQHQIIVTLRLPRTLADLMVGFALSVCGAIMQGTTRNPLADSGLMGINAGATFAMAICFAFLPGRSYGQTMLFACAGAALTTSLTYLAAALGKRGLTPQKLVLSGMSVSMLFGAMSTYLAIRYRIGQSLAFWTSGGTAGAQMNELLFVLPFMLLCAAGAIALSPSVTLLSLGEDVATGLGVRTGLVNALSTLIVLVLSGLSVVIVGPIGFVGLMVPHMVRFLVGVDYRYIIPACMVYGPVLMVSADLMGRMINRPYETPLGVIFAALGVPYFLFLARGQRKEGA